MPALATVVCFVFGTFLPFLCSGPPKEPKETWPHHEVWITTVIPYNRQRAHNVLSDFEHQDKWYSGNKHQEMASPPPHRRIGAMRTMNFGPFPLFSGNDMVLWEEMVNLDDDRFTWAYSIPVYDAEKEKHRGGLPYSFKQRSDVTVYPITTNGNKAAVVEWNIKLNTVRSEETVISGNLDIFGTLFNDLADYLAKQSLPKNEENIYYLLKGEEGDQKLIVTQGSLVEGPVEVIAPKALAATKNYFDLKKPPTGRETNWPTFYNVTYGEGHSGFRAIRPIVLNLGRESFIQKIFGRSSEPPKTFIHFEDEVKVTLSVEEHLAKLKEEFNSFLKGFKVKEVPQRPDL